MTGGVPGPFTEGAGEIAGIRVAQLGCHLLHGDIGLQISHGLGHAHFFQQGAITHAQRIELSLIHI